MTDPAEIAAIKLAGARFKTAVETVADCLEDPLREKFQAASREIDKMVACLPSADQQAKDLSAQITDVIARVEKKKFSVKAPLPTPPQPGAKSQPAKPSPARVKRVTGVC